MTEDSSLMDRCPEGAGVRLITIDGQEHYDFLEKPTGMPENPISDDVLVGKMYSCFEHANVGKKLTKVTAMQVLQLERLNNIGELAIFNPT